MSTVITEAATAAATAATATTTMTQVLTSDGKRSLCNTSKEEPASDGGAEGNVKLTNGSQVIEGALANDQDNDKKQNATDEEKTSSASASASKNPQSSSSSSGGGSATRSIVANSGGDSTTKLTKDTGTEASGTSSSAEDSSTPVIRRPSTTSRFKEKRPEPLKLNPNLNQDIPLDLSVKSAGNVPSGTLGSIFNLAQFNPMAPLETPRIQWQDNDSLLASAKNRLFSSSTTASNRVRMSSIMGESPPITPNTPLMDVMFSSGETSSMRTLNDPPHSATLALESPLHSFLTSPRYHDINRLQILDRLSQPGKHHLLDHHHHQQQQHHHHQMRTDFRGTPRRSCSTDNLYLFMNSGGCGQTTLADITTTRKFKTTKNGDDRRSPTNNLGSNSKKNSISPLATKSLSNNKSGGGSGLESPTKFPYTCQQIAANNNTTDAQQQSPTSNGKSLTPTSVANATVNLFNIHLNSPNSSSGQSPINSMMALNKLTNSNQDNHQQQQLRSPSFPILEQDSRLLDSSPPVSFCQQQQQQHVRRLVSSSSSSSSSGFDKHHHHQQQHLGGQYNRQQSNPSISSTATLNTPTIISPSQMKAGHLSFLPSPTLSPMPSVFDLPSPFLMFAATSAQESQQQQQGLANSSENNNNKSSGLSKSASQNLVSQKCGSLDAHTKKIRSELAGSGTSRQQQQSDRSPAAAQASNSSKQEKASLLLSSSKSSPVALDTPTNVIKAYDGNINVIQTCESLLSSARNDLSQLITSADQKTTITTACSPGAARFELGGDQGDSLNNDIDMDIDDDDDVRHGMEDNENSADDTFDFEASVRPSTVIPQICISNHHAKNASNAHESQTTSRPTNKTQQQQQQHDAGFLNTGRENDKQREQRDLLCKRSLSPETFHARVRNYHNERLESSSAPPDIHQRRRRSKIKTAAAESCLEATSDKVGTDKTSRVASATGYGPHENTTKPAGLSQSAINLNSVQQHHYQQQQQQLNHHNHLHQQQQQLHTRASCRPYPEMRGWLTSTSNQQLESLGAGLSENSLLSGRSSSAEPAVYSVNNLNKITHPCQPAGSNSGSQLENLANSSCQLAGHLYLGQNNSNYAQHHHHPHHHHNQPQQQQPSSHALQSSSDSHRFHNNTSQPHNNNHHHHHHHQQHYHSLSNQQFQYHHQQQQQQQQQQQERIGLDGGRRQSWRKSDCC